MIGKKKIKERRSIKVLDLASDADLMVRLGAAVICEGQAAC